MKAAMPPSDAIPHLVAYAEASAGESPGHLVIGQESSRESAHFGYRFDMADLPPEFQHSSRWRDYLFDHAVPGHIVDESRYVNGLRSATTRHYHVKRAEAESSLTESLPPRGSWFRIARYSFNPDDHGDCFNCVTWGVSTANRLVPDFLLPVRQGRVKLIIQQMEEVAR